MNLINHAPAFEKFVRTTNTSVVCDNKGRFHVESRLITLIRKCVRCIFQDTFGWEARKHLNWLKGLIYVFDYVEQNQMQVTQQQLNAYLKTARTVKNLLRNSKSSKIKEMIFELKLKKLALKY